MIQSKTYTIEVLVAVDKLMIEFYGSNNIEEYVLSLMLIASNNLANIEIGNTIKLAVVDIISLETTLAAYTFYRGTQILGNFSKPLVNLQFRIKNNLSFLIGKKIIFHLNSGKDANQLLNAFQGYILENKRVQHDVALLLTKYAFLVIKIYFSLNT